MTGPPSGEGGGQILFRGRPPDPHWRRRCSNQLRDLGERC